MLGGLFYPYVSDIFLSYFIQYSNALEEHLALLNIEPAEIVSEALLCYESRYTGC